MSFAIALSTYSEFLGGQALTRWIAERECFKNEHGLPSSIDSLGALQAAFTIKRSVGEINTFIHAVGILACLPHILKPGERVSSLSLGAGNTGKDFDLETEHQIAEFKFITWKGADAVRQDSVFADIVKLCLHNSAKKKVLYLTGAELARKFLRGGRSIDSVLSRRPKLRAKFTERFGAEYVRVRDFIACDMNDVHIVDLNDVVPGLAEAIAGD